MWLVRWIRGGLISKNVEVRGYEYIYIRLNVCQNYICIGEHNPQIY